MTQTQIPRIVRIAIHFLPVVVIVAAFFAATPWLKTQSDAVVFAVGALAAISVMAYSAYMFIRKQRGMDEVQRAGSRFAFQAGALAGSIFTVLIVLVPPVQDLIVGWANALGSGSATVSDRESVLLAFVFGLSALVVAQTIGALIVNACWSWWVAKR